MSVPATIWAWRQPVRTVTQRAALLALADHANGAGECWPALEEVAARCAMGRNTTQRAVADLVRAGLVERVKRHRHADGSLGVWHYRLAVDNPAAYTPERYLGDTGAVPRARHRSGTAESLLEPSTESVGTASTSAAVDNPRTRATTAYPPDPVGWCSRCHCLDVDCWPDHRPLAGLRIVR